MFRIRNVSWNQKMLKNIFLFFLVSAGTLVLSGAFGTVLAQNLTNPVDSADSVNLDHREISASDFDVDEILLNLRQAGQSLNNTILEDLARTGQIFENVPGLEDSKPENTESTEVAENAESAGTAEDSKEIEGTKEIEGVENSDPSLSRIEQLQLAEEHLARIVYLANLSEISSGARNTALAAQQADLQAEIDWQNSILTARDSYNVIQDALINEVSVLSAFESLTSEGIVISSKAGKGISVVQIPVDLDEFSIDYLGDEDFLGKYFLFILKDCEGKKIRGEYCQFVWRWRDNGPPIPVNVIISFKNLDSGLYHKIPLKISRNLEEVKPPRVVRVNPNEGSGNPDVSGEDVSNLAPLGSQRSPGDSNTQNPQRNPPVSGPPPQETRPQRPAPEPVISSRDFSFPERTRIRYFQEGQVALDLAVSGETSGLGNRVQWDSVAVSEGDVIGGAGEKIWEVVRIDPVNYQVVLRSVDDQENFVVSRTQRFRSYAELKQDLVVTK